MYVTSSQLPQNNTILTRIPQQLPRQLGDLSTSSIADTIAGMSTTSKLLLAGGVILGGAIFLGTLGKGKRRRTRKRTAAPVIVPGATFTFDQALMLAVGVGVLVIASQKLAAAPVVAR